jgi:uncharacterized membrane protein
MNNYVYIFFPNKVNKYIAWTINFGIFILYKEFQAEEKINNILKNQEEIVHCIKMTFIIGILIHYFLKFKPFFIQE